MGNCYTREDKKLDKKIKETKIEQKEVNTIYYDTPKSTIMIKWESIKIGWYSKKQHELYGSYLNINKFGDEVITTCVLGQEESDLRLREPVLTNGVLLDDFEYIGEVTHFIKRNDYGKIKF
jgi:hypothetical protein